jgi:hypothetical protein
MIAEFSEQFKQPFLDHLLDVHGPQRAKLSPGFEESVLVAMLFCSPFVFDELLLLLRKELRHGTLGRSPLDQREGSSSLNVGIRLIDCWLRELLTATAIAVGVILDHELEGDMHHLAQDVDGLLLQVHAIALHAINQTSCDHLPELIQSKECIGPKPPPLPK